MSTNRPKTCGTCAHASGSFAWGKCALSGFYQETERKYPMRCGISFDGWVERESILTRVRHWLYEDKRSNGIAEPAAKG